MAAYAPSAVEAAFDTVNGYSVTGMDVPGAYWVSSDDSHLWHVHCSGKRKYTNDHAAWQDVASVITGKATTSPSGGDMPKQLYLTASNKPTKIKVAGDWYPLAWETWSPDSASGGSSAVLSPATRYFSQTVDMYLDGLGKEDNLYVRIQTLDRSGVQIALYPIAEIRGTSGDSTNLRVLVSATAPCTITKAWWRVFEW
jgi:hypothetical protein